MKADEYKLMDRCVEEGVSLGLSRARKHNDNPTDQQISSAIQDAVMANVSEWFIFSKEDDSSSSS